jgi:hypothetical protein
MECIEVDRVAPPGHVSVVNSNFKIDYVRNWTGRSMLTWNPLGVQQGQRAGASRNVEFDVD